MASASGTPQQVKLQQNQIETFYVDVFAKTQADHFKLLTDKQPAQDIKLVVDIGGGCGFFAKELHDLTGLRIRVVDTDSRSIDACIGRHIDGLEAVVGDALNPDARGDEDIVCFNLILHHLVGRSESETRELQKRAIMAWRHKSKYVFVNEYIYDSFFGYVSGRIIFEITRNKLLSAFGKLVSTIIPSFKANTFGVGVRFRAHAEWVDLFEESGFEVVGVAYGDPEHTALPLRTLIIREVRKDSFLLRRQVG